MHKIILRVIYIILSFQHILFAAAPEVLERKSSPLATQASSPFSYEDRGGGKRTLRIHIAGTLSTHNWYATDVRAEHIPFYQRLRNDPDVIKLFGDGVVPVTIEDKAFRAKETETLIQGRWIPRFEAGQPHGAQTIFSATTKEPVGYVIAGGGDEAGASELAGMGIPGVWGKGAGSNVVDRIVSVWAPEVRRRGMGFGVRDEAECKAFQCFGGKHLERMDTTASPSNAPSWKISDKNGFVAAASKVSEEECKNPRLDLSGKEFSTPQDMEKYILKETVGKIGASKRYRLIDPAGIVRTFSLHPKFSCLKYHFERRIE